MENNITVLVRISILFLINKMHRVSSRVICNSHHHITNKEEQSQLVVIIRATKTWPLVSKLLPINPSNQIEICNRKVIIQWIIKLQMIATSINNLKSKTIINNPKEKIISRKQSKKSIITTQECKIIRNCMTLVIEALRGDKREGFGFLYIEL